MRIVGGLWKRTPIVVPDIAGLRPTPDRVRETVFNWLSFLCPEMTSVRGLDLFAGTGALGFELASRGARSVVLVEREPYLILGACNPPLAYRALESEPELGVLLPCNVVVYVRDGQTHISAVAADEMLSIVGNDALEPVAAEVRERLESVVARAASS